MPKIRPLTEAEKAFLATLEPASEAQKPVEPPVEQPKDGKKKKKGDDAPAGEGE